MVKQNLPELRIWSWEFKDDKAAKVCMAEYQRGEIYTEKELRAYREYHLSVQLITF